MSDSSAEAHWHGPVSHLVLDWAGTLVDFGAFASVEALVTAFGDEGVEVSTSEAREAMGLAKLDHLRAIGAAAPVAARWRIAHGRDFSDEDAARLHARLVERLAADVAQRSPPVPGAGAVLAWARERGLRIGSCSSYPRAVLEPLVRSSLEHGVAPDHWIASDSLPEGGRPNPFMAWANLIALRAASAAACVKVDDTAPGIDEGRRAGMWTVGVALSGNECGWTLDEYRSAGAPERERRRAVASRRLLAAGAHVVIDTIEGLPRAIAWIDERLAFGRRP